jgi:hypothetical protein
MIDRSISQAVWNAAIRGVLLLGALALVPLGGCGRTGQRSRPLETIPRPGSDTIGDNVEALDPRLDPSGAAAVIRSYYQAIDEHRFPDAYRLWGADGAASGKSFDEFRSGFAMTASVEVTLGPTGPMGAAAGSRYVEVPVRITATQQDGTRRRFEGTYTLRRSVVDGASAEQRSWRIDSARIRRVDAP